MVDLTDTLKPLKKSIQQHHLSGDKFVATVFTDEAKVKLVKALAPHKLKTFITVNDSIVYQSDVEDSTDDTVSIVYSGALEIRVMNSTGFGKKENQQFYPRFLEIYRASPIFEPVILDNRLNVIDGEQRIQVAKDLGISKLPVVIVNATPLQSKFLRLVLNKSNEFQRWNWDEVDHFLEEHQELLPQLEPLAIFGERVLPESYFGLTVLGYEIHSDDGIKTQQSFYKQEHGLAKWAKIKRDELEVVEDAKSSKKNNKSTTSTALF